MLNEAILRRVSKISLKHRTSLDYWKINTFPSANKTVWPPIPHPPPLLVPLHFPTSMTSFVRVINKSIAFHFDLEPGIMRAYWVQPFALSEPFNGGHSGADMPGHNGSQTGKSGPRGKEPAAGLRLNGSDSFAQRKMFIPVYGRVLFPLPEFSWLVLLLQRVWLSGKEQRAHALKAMGMGEKPLHPSLFPGQNTSIIPHEV